ncbi:uncharacterized mitochondrial protein-like protein [Tanacetum coccineum]
MSTNFVAPNTLHNEDTPSSSTTIVDDNEAPQIVSTSKEPTSPILNDLAGESIQEDTSELDENTFINPFCSPVSKENESSSTNQDQSNMHEFYQQHRSTDKWTTNHPLNKVIGDPTKLVMTRSRLNTDVEMCMYALTMSTKEPKNINEAMQDHSWIESIQDELHQFKTAFLNGPLKEEVYVSHPDGFIDPDFPNHVYCLRKALYGLKQSPRAWYEKLSSFLIENHFTKARPKVKHLKEVKRIFRYIKQTYNMNLWYPKDFGVELAVHLDADHAGCHDDCKSTSGGIQFLGEKLSAIAISCNPVQRLFTKALPKERHRDLARSYTSRKSVTPVRNRILVYPDSDKEDEEYCMDITNYEDSYHEDAELPDLPIFSATNEFASVSQQVEKILILALQRKKEEVPMEDVEMDENHDIDHSGSHNKEMEFEVCSLETFTRLHSSTRATVWFKRLVSYAKGNLDYYDSELGLTKLDYMKAFQIWISYAEDDDGMFVIVDVARGTRIGAWLRACYLFIIPRKIQGSFLFHF